MTTAYTVTDMFVIHGGPNSNRLWDAAKYAYDKTTRFTVTFRGTRDRHLHSTSLEMELRILGVQHEDGSGHCFNVTAQIVNNGDPIHGDDPAYQGTKIFYYNAQRRAGSINLTM